MEKIFKTMAKAEKWLADNRFIWNEQTCEFIAWDGRKAALTDWGDDIVCEIWGDD